MQEYNRKIVSALGCSRQDIFNREERPYLKPLPPQRLLDRKPVKTAIVDQRGYTAYQHDFYFVGADKSGTSVCCRETAGELEILDFKPLRPLASYPLPKTQSVSARRFKHRSQFSPEELYVTRTLSDFKRLAAQLPLFKELLVHIFEAVFSGQLPDMDKTSVCNYVLKLCTDYELFAPSIKEGLQTIIAKGCYENNFMRDVVAKAINKGPEQAEREAEEFIRSSAVRGADYYKGL